MNRMKKFIGFLIVLCFSISLAACLPGTDEPSLSPTPSPNATDGAQQYKPATVRVAYMPNMGSASALVTALRKGYFDEVNLDVKLTQFQGGPAEIAAMASGDIDISQIGHGAHALAIEGQAKVFHIDCLSVADEVLGNKDKGVTSAADLKGKTVAATAGTSAEIILNLVLNKAGLTQNDINLVEMDANGIVSAMVSGNVDACATWDPSTVLIKNNLKDKIVVLGTNKDFLNEVTFPSSFITTEKYADENRDVLVRFSQAILKAQDYRKANIEEVCGWVAEEIEADKETILQGKDSGEWLTGEFISEALADGIIEDYYSGQQSVFIQSGRIPNQVPVNNYVMFDIMKDAVEAYKGNTGK